MNQEQEILYQELLNLNTAERNIETQLKMIFRQFNSEDDWTQNYSTLEGLCDMISFSNKVVIETKKRGHMNIEENKTQLLKYLDGVVPHFNNELWNQGQSIVWKGIITDGQLWACYDYDSNHRKLREMGGGKSYSNA